MLGRQYCVVCGILVHEKTWASHPIHKHRLHFAKFEVALVNVEVRVVSSFQEISSFVLSLIQDYRYIIHATNTLQCSLGREVLVKSAFIQALRGSDNARLELWS